MKNLRRFFLSGAEPKDVYSDNSMDFSSIVIVIVNDRNIAR